MDDSTLQLKRENQQLRREIQHFQRILQEITVNSGTFRANSTRRDTLKANIRAKVENGEFSPPKDTRNRAILRKKRENKEKKEGMKGEIGKELTSDLSRIEISLNTLEGENPGLKPALKEEITALRESLEALISTHSRTMKDSFESYYNSERENIEINGKPELSFEEYQREHSKGERRKNRDLSSQIKRLKSENERLRNVLEKTEKRGKRGRKTCRMPCRVPSRTPPRSSCHGCDFLLSRGLSSTRCRLHLT